ncbi:Transcription factor Spt20 [Artemisia annua]|uniref:Transcription factor Spt20 n=1 Tax=Artemisia annua TaxID=35608 RepID=A0A2U1MWC0_ARTAN|nr:Transcription factor Spt20 [Artemisia annua]
MKHRVLSRSLFIVFRLLGAVQKPLPTIPILSGIGSSSSIGNTSGPSVASGAVQKPLPTIPMLSGTGPSSSIGTWVARYKLDCKELKIDDYKPTTKFSSSQLNQALINNNSNRTLKDETCKMPLSMSHAGGNVNLCKTRILKFVKEAYIKKCHGFTKNCV